ncbi:alpha/beta hydrolase [Robertkochia solimangrovi]|uniref:alpha/beta hydrolase n=1 Tax=Robertkochia solimangrovi TaxID=2213046 RepID=UPI001180C0F5|nr:alpha/beta hydrolase-fold protein [Robertkochia solimangrovi]TRZ46345.1 alpha/beta hydrolase [Robertkochia solimangrovi]
MKKLLILLLVSFGIISCQQKSEPEKKSISIHSEILNEERICLIDLPDSYNDPDEPGHSYPVLILLDGETFFKTTSGIVHFMSSGTNRNYFMPETIIVAIENVDRERDFTITKIKTTRPNTMGGGKHFLKFIENELLPYLDKNYRTQASRTLVGHSLGGLLTVNAYLDENSMFDNFLAIDPSLWWDEATMLEKIENTDPRCFEKRLYIATANQGEKNEGKNKLRHERFYKGILATGNSMNITHNYWENEDHRSVPLPAIYEGLRYLNAE